MNIAVIFVLFDICVLVLALLKVNNAYKNRMRICTAIYHYNIDVAVHVFNAPASANVDDILKQKISYDAMEPFEKTFWRFWDWGYTRIVDKETFEKIKPYI